MEIVPSGSIDQLIAILTSMVTSNALVIIGIIAFSVSIAFIFRWFRSSNKMLTGDKGFFNGVTGKWEKW